MSGTNNTAKHEQSQMRPTQKCSNMCTPGATRFDVTVGCLPNWKPSRIGCCPNRMPPGGLE
eukprot:8815478-Alexandrium_andersonii.AAC.1